MMSSEPERSTVRPARREPAAFEDPRVYFAAERTLLAWLRTGLAMMGFGFVVARFGLLLHELAHGQAVDNSHHTFSVWMGSGLVMMGAAVTLLSAWKHVQDVERLRDGGQLRPRPLSLGIVLALGLAALGIVMAGYLLVAG